MSDKKKPPKKGTLNTAKGATSPGKKFKGFTDDELGAMRERVQELRADKANDEGALLAKIAAMPAADRAMAERLHAVIKASAPSLSPKTWYGMPAYANKEGKVVCFFRDGQKFKERYMTFGFNPDAKLDEGTMWPIAFALTKVTAAEEGRIATLVKRAVS